MSLRELPKEALGRSAVVYVRQSTGLQVQENRESQRRQYELVELARRYGFRDVHVIDQDLGRSASGTADRPGFRDLVGRLCEGAVGAVFCLEASRLARNGRDWHHLLELCGLVGAYVIDTDGVHDPALPNDRLLLGLKGTMSEFELTLFRKRLSDAIVAKARRGELRIGVPVGYVWSRETGLMMDPDRRVQDAIRTIFRLFERLGSAMQVLLHMRREGLLFPRPVGGKGTSPLAWRAPAYRNVLSVLQNPFYAGAYAYGKSKVQTDLVDGSLRKRYGRARPMDSWAVLLQGHHEAYVPWDTFERNRRRLARNSYSQRAGAAKSSRGGQALMAGLLRCRRCGRMLKVTYSGRYYKPRYGCRLGRSMHGIEPCIAFGARRPDLAIAQEILLVVQPLAVEAALMAEREAISQRSERTRALELERQQAEYGVKIAARRYEQVDPDNRLVAAELEARWNAAMARLRDCEARLLAQSTPEPAAVDRESLLSLANDLEGVWNSSCADMRTKQRLVRALIEEIVVDVEDASREVVLVVHWRGGQHSELRVRKPQTGEHTMRNSAEVDQVVRQMGMRWSDEHIAATLNRMGTTTPFGHTWDAKRVGDYRRTKGIPGYESAVKDGTCLTMVEAAKKAGVTCHVIRKLIRDGILPAKQYVFDAPWQILAADLDRPEVQEALRGRRRRAGRPCRNSPDPRTLVIPGT
ncbi:MAG TPA: recombinase family protein [Polyangiaceae bacterium]|nr:recombinase family protein [Polyangiaceae bacterium]